MIRRLVSALVMCALIGCGRPATAPESSLPSGSTQPYVIFEAFTGNPAIAYGPGAVRAGGYFNFAEYDSIRISFSVTRLTPESTFDHVIVKIGPAWTVDVPLSALQQEYSILVKRSDLAKPNFAALVFLVPDPDVVLQFSRLRVIGWAAG